MRIDYSNLFIIIFIAFFLVGVLYLLFYLLIIQKIDLEKNSLYECGFLPFKSTQTAIDVGFYLVAILFIIFDLEIIFSFPLLLSLMLIGFYGIFSFLIFIFFLSLFFIYEWLLGALEW